MDVMENLFVLLIFALSANQISAQGCVWNLNTDIPDRDPIYLKPSTSDFMIPGATGLTLEVGQSMDLVCSGSSSNIIVGTGLKEIRVTCAGNNQLTYNGATYTLKSLECSSPVSSDLALTGQTCAKGIGEIFKIGFKTSKGTALLIDVCYDKTLEKALYAQHILYGKSLTGAEVDSNRPDFRTLGLTYGTTTANLYTQTSQLSRFTTLLGQTQATKLINSTSFLARGHLAPDADFLFGSWSFATYYYVNVAPEWQIVNAGNWLRVEDMARTIAMQKQEDLIIYTGTHMVLKLPNSLTTMVNMYLMAPNKLRVPKWYWKIIYSPSKQEGIALITLNNPHAKSVTTAELFCPNICQQTGWYRPEFLSITKGYTFCCSVNSLATAVGTLPSLAVIKNMNGPI